MQPRAGLTRRQMLGAAAAGTAGLVAMPIAGYEVWSHMQRPPAAAVPPPSPWPSPLGSARARAAHLLRRAGFGATSAELDSAAGLPYSELVDQVVGQRADPMPAPVDSSVNATVAAWYAHMAGTTSPFVERMTLFWHGLLTSDRMSAGPLPLVQQQLTTFRAHATGDFRSLLVAATHDPLMMRYLNLDESTAAAPNENYSRELMELFTLGPGVYTETDVREGARALSGLRIVVEDRSGNRVRLPSPKGRTQQQYEAAIQALIASGVSIRSVLVPRLHDEGMKTYLGRSGNLGPGDVIDAVLAQPACAAHIASRALTEFCMPAPPPSLVQEVAAGFRRSGYDIRELMRSIFLSEAFTSPQAYRAVLRAPAHLVAAVLHLLNLPRLATTGAQAAAAMGQELYSPPNVGGWRLNAGWVSSGAWIARLNFAAAVSARWARRLPSVGDAVRDQLDSVLTPATSHAVNSAARSADAWYAILAGPEFHMQ